MSLPRSKMEILRSNATYHIDQLLESLAGPAEAAERERLLFELSRQHRLAGVAALLLDADVVEFRRHLAQSARVRGELLRLPREGGSPSRYRCASHLAPLFDGVVAREPRLTSEIAWLSPQEWNQGDEYQEDFLYARCIHALVLGARGAELEGRIAVLRALFEAEGGTGADRARLAVCEALHRLDAVELDRALQELLERLEEEFQKQERALLADPLRHHAEKSVCVEGLALVELARERGLALEGDYPALPAIVRGTQAPGART